MTEKKDTPSVNNSIQTRLSGVMLMVLVFALGINFFIFSQIQNTQENSPMPESQTKSP